MLMTHAGEGKELVTVAHQAPAPDLRQLGAVNRFLESKDLGVLQTSPITSFAGRNAIWAGLTSIGCRVFVKRISGEPESAARRFRVTPVRPRLSPGFLVDGSRGPAPDDHLRRVYVHVRDAADAVATWRGALDPRPGMGDLSFGEHRAHVVADALVRHAVSHAGAGRVDIAVATPSLPRCSRSP